MFTAAPSVTLVTFDECDNSIKVTMRQFHQSAGSM